MPIKFLGSLPRKNLYFIVVFMLISTLSTSFILQAFVLILFFILYFFMFCEKLADTLGWLRRDSAENIIPLDYEFERTLKRILIDKREVVRMEQQPMGSMEENREDDVCSIRGGSIDPVVANMDTMLPPIRDYGRPSVVTPPVIRRTAIQANNFELKPINLQLL